MSKPLQTKESDCWRIASRCKECGRMDLDNRLLFIYRYVKYNPQDAEDSVYVTGHYHHQCWEKFNSQIVNFLD